MKVKIPYVVHVMFQYKHKKGADYFSMGNKVIESVEAILQKDLIEKIDLPSCPHTQSPFCMDLECSDSVGALLENYSMRTNIKPNDVIVRILWRDVSD